MCGTWMDGWVGGWVEKRGSFFTWPCIGGASFSPRSLFLFPRQTMPVTGLAVLASLGHSGIPPHHAAPSIPLPPAVFCPLEGFHLYWSSFFGLSAIFYPSIYRHGCFNTSASLTTSPAFLFFCLLILQVVKRFCACELQQPRLKCLWYSVRGLVFHKRKAPPCDVGFQMHPAVLMHRRTFISLVWHVKIFFDKQDHTTLCSASPRLPGLCGNAMRVVMLLSPRLDELALYINFICLNGFYAFLTDLWLTRY